MNRPYLFMSGEFQASMPTVFLRDAWQHTMTPKRLLIDNGVLHRENIIEDLKGIIFYADVDNKDIEIQNLRLLHDNSILCLPLSNTLLNMVDRHEVLLQCSILGFVDHPIIQARFEEKPSLPLPFVLKIGTSHRGEGKFLITKEFDMPEWKGIATIEPFFEGDSIRVLLIKDFVIGNFKAFGIKLKNDNSWIKNSSGADIEFLEDIPQNLLDHAIAVTKAFELDIAGVDYILNKHGFHFLEINQFPGVGASDEIIETAKKLFNVWMILIERRYEIDTGKDN